MLINNYLRIVIVVTEAAGNDLRKSVKFLWECGAVVFAVDFGVPVVVVPECGPRLTNTFVSASEECFNEWLRRKRETEERRRREENERMESETREVMRKWKEWKAGPRVMSHRKWSKIKDGEDK